MKKMTKISTAIASLLIVGAANAVTPGAYVGVGAGYSMLRTSNPFNTSHVSSSSNDRGGLGGRLFAGYNFNNYFGLETGYATYANSTYKVSGGGASASVKYALDAFNLVGKGYLPIADTGVNAYVLGGVAEARSEITTKASIPGKSVSDTNKTNSLRPTYGIGVSYDIADHLTSSVELSRIQGKGNTKNVDSSAIPNADMVTLNLGYNFG